MEQLSVRGTGFAPRGHPLQLGQRIDVDPVVRGIGYQQPVPRLQDQQRHRPPALALDHDIFGRAPGRRLTRRNAVDDAARGVRPVNRSVGGDGDTRRSVRGALVDFVRRHAPQPGQGAQAQPACFVRLQPIPCETRPTAVMVEMEEARIGVLGHDLNPLPSIRSSTRKRKSPDRLRQPEIDLGTGRAR